MVDKWGDRRALLVVLLVVLAVGTKSFWVPLLSLDEQSNVVYGDQVLAGRVPHRDFFATYGPANYWLVAGAFQLFGASVESQRLVGLIYHFAIGAAVYLCCFRRTKTVAVAAATTAVLFLIPVGSVAYAWLGALAVLLFSIAILQRASARLPYALAGAVGVSCAWWRPEMLGVALLCAVPFLLPRLERAFAYAVGVLVALLPMVVFTVVAGSSWLTNVLTRLGVNAGYSSVDPYVVVGGCVVAAFGVAMLGLGIRRRDPTCVTLSVLIAAAMPQLLQRPDVAHLAFVACATVPLSIAHVLPPIPGRPTVETREEPHSRLLRVELTTWLASALAVAVAVGVVGLVERQRTPVVHVAVGERSLIADPASAPRIRATIDTLMRASSDGPIFIGAQDMSQATLSWAMLYHLLPDANVQAYYLEIPPGLNETQTTVLSEDVRASHVLLLTEFTDADRQLLFPKIQPIPDYANVAVRESYCPVAETPYGAVLSRCIPVS